VEANTTILDALADAAIRTIARYEQHMENGRHLEAKQCMSAVEAITLQVQQIEENDKSEEARYSVKLIS